MEKSTSSQILDLNNQVISLKGALKETESNTKDLDGKHQATKKALDLSEKNVVAAEELINAKEEENIKLMTDINNKEEQIQQMEHLVNELEAMKKEFDIVKKEQDSKYITLQDSLHTAHSD
eukprot:11884666-Ditylum_brightwellii.AAC.1